MEKVNNDFAKSRPLALADDGKEDNDNNVPLVLTDDSNKDNDNDDPIALAGGVAIFEETSYALQKSISKKRSFFGHRPFFLGGGGGDQLPSLEKALLSDTQGMTCNDRTWVW